MDRTLRHFGLSGKAFIPLLMGFGCTVPAVMGARTMENEKDRRMTIMLVPFMSCSARLPIYGLLVSAFFPGNRALIVISLYLIGICLAILSGLILKRSIFRGEAAPFLLELPPYRIPTVRNVGTHVWGKSEGLFKPGGYTDPGHERCALAAAELHAPRTVHHRCVPVLLAALGSAIAPLFLPCGFGVWQAAVALLTGLIAKEAVVSSMSLFYGFSLTASGATVTLALGGTFTPWPLTLFWCSAHFTPHAWLPSPPSGERWATSSGRWPASAGSWAWRTWRPCWSTRSVHCCFERGFPSCC